ncbi:MAG: DUF4124 domain-containing protein [Pseudomonadota bacterium]
MTTTTIKPLLLTAALLLAAAPASADYFSAQGADGVPSFSDRPLATGATTTRIAEGTVTVPSRAELIGTWTAEEAGGRYISFHVEANGKFVFDERHRHTPARVYMCGSVATTTDSLALDVKARKEMQASGDTEELRNAGTVEFEVVAARENRLVLDLDGTQFVFFRG